MAAIVLTPFEVPLIETALPLVYTIPRRQTLRRPQRGFLSPAKSQFARAAAHMRDWTWLKPQGQRKKANRPAEEGSGHGYGAGCRVARRDQNARTGLRDARRPEDR